MKSTVLVFSCYHNILYILMFYYIKKIIMRVSQWLKDYFIFCPIFRSRMNVWVSFIVQGLRFLLHHFVLPFFNVIIHVLIFLFRSFTSVFQFALILNTYDICTRCLFENHPLSIIATSINTSQVVSCTCVIIYSSVSSLITTTAATLVTTELPDVYVLLFHAASLVTFFKNELLQIYPSVFLF